MAYYNSSHTLLGTYNVKDYAAAGTTIPITVNNGLSYTMDVRFENVPEPSSIVLAGTSALAENKSILLINNKIQKCFYFVGAWGVGRYLGRKKEDGKEEYEIMPKAA